MFLVRIGQFLRILDESGQISLTNVAMIVSIYKLVVVPTASYAEIGTFLLAAAAYNFKKVLGNGSNGTPQ